MSRTIEHMLSDLNCSGTQANKIRQRAGDQFADFVPILLEQAEEQL